MGASKVYDPAQIVIALDHDVQNKSSTNLKKYQQIEEFSKTQDICFYPPGRGIGHQIMVEEGYAWPGSLVVASDSHANMYGGVGCRTLSPSFHFGRTFKFQDRLKCIGTHEAVLTLNISRLCNAH